MYDIPFKFNVNDTVTICDDLAKLFNATTAIITSRSVYTRNDVPIPGTQHYVLNLPWYDDCPVCIFESALS